MKPGLPSFILIFLCVLPATAAKSPEVFLFKPVSKADLAFTRANKAWLQAESRQISIRFGVFRPDPIQVIFAAALASEACVQLLPNGDIRTDLACAAREQDDSRRCILAEFARLLYRVRLGIKAPPYEWVTEGLVTLLSGKAQTPEFSKKYRAALQRRKSFDLCQDALPKDLATAVGTAAFLRFEKDVPNFLVLLSMADSKAEVQSQLKDHGFDCTQTSESLVTQFR